MVSLVLTPNPEDAMSVRRNVDSFCVPPPRTTSFRPLPNAPTDRTALPFMSLLIVATLVVLLVVAVIASFSMPAMIVLFVGLLALRVVGMYRGWMPRRGTIPVRALHPPTRWTARQPLNEARPADRVARSGHRSSL
jgi:hypothetical protein